jgi:hypothetical protein
MSLNIVDWLQFNLGSTAPLTGTDHRALRAAVAILELYAYDGDASLLTNAFGAVVRRMQPTTREYAYHTIAAVLDWNDRARIWAEAGLTPIAKPWRCEAEPQHGKEKPS